ncbi:MAG: CCA tRNA nucleotidyltransferase [Azospirillum brasilense]|nr:MAG: CCA tRNA nucleotidyltransferase [Azospirillum brasilense]
MRPDDAIPTEDLPGAPGDAPHARVLPPERLTRGAPLAVLRALPGSRTVGGCVRDALAGRAIADVDVGVPLPPEVAVPLLRSAGLKVVETGLAHGTVTAIGGGEPVEVTSLRRDVSTDGRHAEVEWTADWREDAARRDFTINAMSMDAEGNLWDWFGGRTDLAAGVVRFVGDPATRLREDYLRALRFFRFQARYGTGAPDAAALAAIREAVPGLARLSAERVWSETKRLLAAPDPSGALLLMLDSGVLAAILPEAVPSPSELAAVTDRITALGRGIAAGLPPDPVLRLAALLPPGARGAGGRIARRLRFSNEERDVLEGLTDREPLPDPAPDDDSLRRWLSLRDDTGAPIREAWLAELRDGRDRAALRARMAAMPVPRFPLQGRDALAMGVPPGPQLGRMLRMVEEWWREGGCRADAGACRMRLTELMKDITEGHWPTGQGRA